MAEDHLRVARAAAHAQRVEDCARIRHKDLRLRRSGIERSLAEVDELAAIGPALVIAIEHHDLVRAITRDRVDEYVVDTVSRSGVHKCVAIWKYDKRLFNKSPVVYYGMRLMPVEAEPELRAMVELELPRTSAVVGKVTPKCFGNSPNTFCYARRRQAELGALSRA